jgi:hypothetical protein
MKYTQEITDNGNKPGILEEIYQTARRSGEVGEFTADLKACYAGAPENMLYAAWYFRLERAVEEPKKREAVGANWKLAAPLAVLNGLVFWALSDPNFMINTHIPTIVLLSTGVAACFVMVFLSFTAQKNILRSLLAFLGLAAVFTAAMLLAGLQSPNNRNHYLDLLAVHLPLLSVVGVGVSLIGLKSSLENRFAFLIKAIEVMITGGVYLIAGVAFGMITVGMFQSLSIELPDYLMRLIIAGGIGLLPVLAVTTIFDPKLEPASQDFSQGLSKFIFTMMRLLLPLTLGVLVIFVLVIPFNFMQPFINRDVLIVYNAMLFGIMGLLVGATPIHAEELSERLQKVLRWGILAVAVLAVLVSVYALAAIIYRTVGGGITMNRMVVLGWNTINIGLLIAIIVKQIRKGGQAWDRRIKAVFSIGAFAYTLWAVFVILSVPIFFR